MDVSKMRGKLENIKTGLKYLYGVRAEKAIGRILPLIEGPELKPQQKENYFSQEDVVLITYGDTLQQRDELTLKIFRSFASHYFKDVFSHIHFLPFFPYSSDDGFSVKDFYAVNPELGNWDVIREIGHDFKLMFDMVLNHISAQSDWFKYYLAGQEGFADLAIEVDPDTDLSKVTRPRSLPLLTAFKKASGKTAHVWTTFSADQIDLNYKSLNVLEKMVEVFMLYINKGATILRLDAIAYLWKEVGTSCIHLKETHAMVKLFRALLDVIAPNVILLTETNVPHAENMAYFGNGRDEAQMIYNFTLPPLLLYTFIKEDATVLNQWAKGLRIESDQNTFFNFTASHDGIGVRPLEGILPQGEIDRLIETVRQNGGDVSFRHNSDGTQSPYELNITYVDALGKYHRGSDPLHTQRFLASQTIQYALPGVPATYIHSLLGSRNWADGVRMTGRARSINRQKLDIDEVKSQLDRGKSFRAGIFYPYVQMIKIRRRQPAFHPNAAVEILDVNPRIFALGRYCEKQKIYAVTNVSSEVVSFVLPDELPGRINVDLLTDSPVKGRQVALGPYQSIWLSKEHIR